jgi:type IV pilus assembly protein PilW
MRSSIHNNAGFSLTELLVALAMVGIVSVAMYMSFSSQSRSFVKQEQAVDVQQNVRAAMDIMVRDIRLACYDPTRSGNFTPENIDVRPRNFANAPAANGWGAITVRSDSNGAPNGAVDNGEEVAYSLNNASAAFPGSIVLARDRNDGAGRRPLIGFVEGLVFAFAFDADGDEENEIDRDAAGNIIWAVDTTADGELDRAIDTNGDGVIDLNDDPAGVAISAVHPQAIATVPPDAVRAVRIWLLVRSERQDPGLNDNRTYVLGNRRFTPNQDETRFQRRLLTETVWMRNAGL